MPFIQGEPIMARHEFKNFQQVDGRNYWSATNDEGETVYIEPQANTQLKKDGDYLVILSGDDTDQALVFFTEDFNVDDSHVVVATVGFQANIQETYVDYLDGEGDYYSVPIVDGPEMTATATLPDSTPNSSPSEEARKRWQHLYGDKDPPENKDALEHIRWLGFTTFAEVKLKYLEVTKRTKA
ncbi:hypothetical protein [Luteibacter sp. 3190]|uniref:hypothetical protein n=1 Tax=Luteibacter sp. 3190 TaxID=2817736 RepID=UPI00286B91D0|nr:hypothetical protein [Luteibacter sp. 3190]